MCLLGVGLAAVEINAALHASTDCKSIQGPGGFCFLQLLKLENGALTHETFRVAGNASMYPARRKGSHAEGAALKSKTVVVGGLGPSGGVDKPLRESSRFRCAL